MATITLKQGDVIQQLKTIPDESIDVVIQDPPYNLNFMNKKWGFKGCASRLSKNGVNRGRRNALECYGAAICYHSVEHEHITE